MAYDVVLCPLLLFSHSYFIIFTPPSLARIAGIGTCSLPWPPGPPRLRAAALALPRAYPMYHFRIRLFPALAPASTRSLLPPPLPHAGLPDQSQDMQDCPGKPYQAHPHARTSWMSHNSGWRDRPLPCTYSPARAPRRSCYPLASRNTRSISTHTSAMHTNQCHARYQAGSSGIAVSATASPLHLSACPPLPLHAGILEWSHDMEKDISNQRDALCVAGSGAILVGVVRSTTPPEIHCVSRLHFVPTMYMYTTPYPPHLPRHGWLAGAVYTGPSHMYTRPNYVVFIASLHLHLRLRK
ncbi:hypothetical protein BD410DRAFT_845967 [Rickenella mellea]|uniref:Uncharacterized protein n=1 Tax=Rickenella mellea TaxID=50990 RepID=A0A4Y7PGL8_9AGAM|nr:hypothetical protein BD410DRAFT_845967 [Rickenella mellea]